jgi:hypothetical protein
MTNESSTSHEDGLQQIQAAWSLREGPAILTTVDPEKKPNSVYVGEIGFLPGEGFVVANNYFHKTFENLSADNLGSILFLTEKRDSFQVKGPLSYHTQGPIFDFMRAFHNPKHPGHGAVLLRVKEAYQGSHPLI